MFGTYQFSSLVLENHELLEGVYRSLQGDGNILIKASLFIDDMATDLLSSTGLKVHAATDNYMLVESFKQLIEYISLMTMNIQKMSESLSVHNIHKLSHQIITFRNDSCEIHLYVLPTYDRTMKTKATSFNDWLRLKSTLLGGMDNSFAREDCLFIDYIQDTAPTASSQLFLVFTESSPDTFADNLPLLEETSRLRLEIQQNRNSRARRQRTESSAGENEGLGAVGDYANKLILEANNMVALADNIYVDIEMT